MPSTHLLESWLLANAIPTDRRGRLAITLSGVLPDLDGLGYPFEALSKGTGHELFWFEDFHHILLHNLPSGICFALIAYFACGKSLRVALGSLAAFHLHMLCDLVGSAGADGEIWPLYYLMPFSRLEFSWAGQWRLDSWINIFITLACEALMLCLAWRRGFSPLEMLSPRLDSKLIESIKRFFGRGFQELREET